MKANKNTWIIILLMLVLSTFIAFQNAECDECRLWNFIANQGYTIYDSYIQAGIQLDAFYEQSSWPPPWQPHGWGSIVL